MQERVATAEGAMTVHRSAAGIGNGLELYNFMLFPRLLPDGRRRWVCRDVAFAPRIEGLRSCGI
jgi:hypothetical protein